MSLIRAPRGLVAVLVNLGCIGALVCCFDLAHAASATYATVGYDRAVTLESPKEVQSIFSMESGEQDRQANTNEAVDDKEHQEVRAD